MRKFLPGLFLFMFFLMPCSAAAATINAASCLYEDVSEAINSASPEDTVIVPAGTCTWDNQLVITKGIYLIGAGIGQTVITSGYDAPSPSRTDSSSYLIFYNPMSPAANEAFRFSGFSFDLNDRCGFMNLYKPTITPINKIRIDHNSITDPTRNAIMSIGNIYGVVDNNAFIGSDSLYVFVSPYGLNEKSWNNLTFDFGSANNLYFEDNEFTSSNGFFDGGMAGRVCIRYNNFIYTGGNDETVVDAHGNQPGANHAAMGVEVYENTLDFGSASIPLIGHRGGKGLLYNNYVTTTGSYVAINIAEEYNDSLNPPASSPISGQPQHISDSYYWNNLKNSVPVTDVNIVYTVDYGGDIGIVPQANRDFWYEGAAAFDGTSGVGAGLLSSRPPTCTVGVGYWASEENKLYRCTATNTWTLYYTPYTYPHPLRTDCTNYPEMCDSGAATINAASCSYSDVSAAINATSPEDTVQVPAGTCTWNNQLVITKGIQLIGAGVGSTVITSGFVDDDNYLIIYQPAAPASNHAFRISGFTITCGSNGGALEILNYNANIITKVRVDHNNFSRTTGGRLVNVHGNVNGVIDNNTLSARWYAATVYGNNEQAWTDRTFTPGTVDNFYVEDNTINIEDGSHAGGAGGRYCIRYNTYNFITTDGRGAQPWFDAHGNMGVGGNLASMGAEIYENTITLDGMTCTIFDHRGGEAIVFNNTALTTASVATQVREEHNDSLNPPAVASDGEPQYISDSYYWNNLHNNIRVDPHVSETLDYGGTIGVVPRANVHYWFQGDTFDGTTGVGVGLISARPGSCTIGVGYWASEENKLYRCTATNTWTEYYTPFIHPHPLTVAPFGAVICDEGQISSQCWCQGMKSTGYCCHGYHQTTDCAGGSQPVAGDLNGDGVVNINDLSFIGMHFGRTNMHPQWNLTADLVANNEIDIYDVVFVASRFS